MGKTFRKIHISLAGDFGPMSEKIKQWVEAKKDATTHLIATKDAFRKHDAAVQQARNITGLKIVKLEWLEDSLLSKKRRPKRETEYLWYQTRGTRKRDTVKKTNAVMDMDAVDTDDHHIFTDFEGFRYLVTLVRPLEDSKLKEKHTLPPNAGNNGRREWPAQSLCRGKTGGDVSYPVAKIGLGTNHRERYAHTVVKGVASNGVAVNWSRQGYHFFR
ncbi:predicted protein [Histoplasma mississippiense (nom. inval.)]|uniref:predicted protein n=1 Tax=Ajellomyces capsulatus (strain NAm1 / WU24) TaxID=2059318 RepID=UPI000157B601|nr:predicted protein [Histoplasma mississippiense (nom. inval.)]EDN02885.1 predicted protein [Histoplasma mississippiense (nom. inval.)]